MLRRLKSDRLTPELLPPLSPLSLRGGGEGEGTGVVSSRSKMGPGEARGAGVASEWRCGRAAADVTEIGDTRPGFAAALSQLASMARACFERCASDLGDARGAGGAACAASAAVDCCSSLAVSACRRRVAACGGGCDGSGSCALLRVCSLASVRCWAVCGPAEAPQSDLPLRACCCCSGLSDTCRWSCGGERTTKSSMTRVQRGPLCVRNRRRGGEATEAHRWLGTRGRTQERLGSGAGASQVGTVVSSPHCVFAAVAGWSVGRFAALACQLPRCVECCCAAPRVD